MDEITEMKMSQPSWASYKLDKRVEFDNFKGSI